MITTLDQSLAMLLGVLGCPEEIDRIKRQAARDRPKDDDVKFRQKVAERTQMWLETADAISKGEFVKPEPTK